MKKGKVVKFYAANAAENPDNVIEQAIGEFESIVLAGFDHSGVLDIRASTNISRERALWILEKAKMVVLSPDCDE